jgi:hypothetical protein
MYAFLSSLMKKGSEEIKAASLIGKFHSSPLKGFKSKPFGPAKT